MKAHIGVDVASSSVHSLTSTAANVADLSEIDKLLHGREKAVHADAGYSGADKRAPKRGRRWYIAAKRSKAKAITDEKLRALTDQIEHAKNHTQVMTLFARANLWMARKRLLAATGQLRPDEAKNRQTDPVNNPV